MNIKAGDIIALVGESGSGKSTLLKILAGLLMPTQGAVKLDDTEVRQMGIRAYRTNVGGVLQTDQLLSGSIAENITFFDDPIDHERMIRAAQMAAISDLIQSLPMGFNSLIGDMGSTLSAGQAQRVLLARAFYKQPKLLLLDEATANLDEQREMTVLKSLADLKVTTVLITHRPAPLEFADRVLQVEQASIRQLTLPARSDNHIAS